MKLFRTAVKAISLTTLILGQLQAAPIFNQQFSFKQPDSSFVPVIVNGDEFYKRVEDLNGRTLTQDENGWYCYASLNIDSTALIPGERYTGQNRSSRSGEELHIDLKPEAIKAKAMEQRRIFLGTESTTRSSVPPSAVIGNKVGLTILVEFPDQPAALSKSEVEDMLNGDNGITMKNYFHTVSGGKLNYTNQVLGYYRAKGNIDDYEDPSLLPQKLLREILDWADSTGFDFSSVSLYGKSVVALNVLYAGEPNDVNSALWPHRAGFRWTGKKSGYSVNQYQISYLKGRSKHIGVICHENGHLLMNYLDVYSTTASQEKVGRYCLMSTGCWGDEPTPPNPYFRKLSGWLDPEDITNVENATITMNSNDPSRAIMYKNKSDRYQFYLMESIDRSGTYAGHFPASGMLVWKINERGNNLNPYMNGRMVEVVGGTGSSAPFRSQSGVAFSSTTSPAALWHNNVPSSIVVRAVSPAGTRMTFNIGNGGDTIGIVDTSNTNGHVDTSNTNGTEVTTLTLTTASQNGSVRLSSTGPEFVEGSVVTATAEANYGYVFDYWSGDLSGANNPATVTMNANKSITAHFKLEQQHEQGNYIAMPSGDINIVRIMYDTIFCDDGGPDRNYADNVNGTVSIRPGIYGKTVQIEFLEFALDESVPRADAVESSMADTLEIFKGRGTENSLGSWSGTDNPGVIRSTADDGSLTVRWVSNSVNAAPGWKAKVTLVDPISDDVSLAEAAKENLTLGMRAAQNGIALMLPSAGEYTVEIFSTNGRLINSFEGTALSVGIQNLPLQNIASGVYIARLQLEGTAVTQTVILK